MSRKLESSQPLGEHMKTNELIAKIIAETRDHKSVCTIDA